jgi:hypothetical protein
MSSSLEVMDQFQMNCLISMTRIKVWFYKKVSGGVFVPFYWVFKVLGLAGFTWRRQKFQTYWHDYVLFVTNVACTFYFTTNLARQWFAVPYSTVLALGLNFLENFPAVFIEIFLIGNFVQRKSFWKILQAFRRLDAKVRMVTTSYN